MVIAGNVSEDRTNTSTPKRDIVAQTGGWLRMNNKYALDKIMVIFTYI
jgi:hypothetical protein